MKSKLILTAILIVSLCCCFGCKIGNYSIDVTPTQLTLLKAVAVKAGGEWGERHPDQLETVKTYANGLMSADLSQSIVDVSVNKLIGIATDPVDKMMIEELVGLVKVQKDTGMEYNLGNVPVLIEYFIMGAEASI